MFATGTKLYRTIVRFKHLLFKLSRFKVWNDAGDELWFWDDEDRLAAPDRYIWSARRSTRNHDNTADIATSTTAMIPASATKASSNELKMRVVSVA